MVRHHPRLLTSQFMETGSWLGLPAWAAATAGWWAMASALSLLLLPLLAFAGAFSPLLLRIARLAGWLPGWGLKSSPFKVMN